MHSLFSFSRRYLKGVLLPKHMDSVFNVTATYSKRSDILFDYGRIEERRDANLVGINLQIMINKTKLVAWMASNCQDVSGRLQYVKELRKYIPVDVYGNCGTLKCGERKDYSCFEMLQREYKFYLSFENSICKEYLTEKIWNALKHFLVPVVLGGADYAHLLPPNSYIDVANFSSPKKLGEYLMRVSRDEVLYMSYFEWKKSYGIWIHDEEYGLEEIASMTCDYLKHHTPPFHVPSWHDFLNPSVYCTSNEKYYSSFLNLAENEWAREILAGKGKHVTLKVTSLFF